MRFYITTNPDDPEEGYEAIVEAVNQLEALDKYAVSQGFAEYSSVEGLEESLGIDTHGFWGVFTNYTIWAIPIKPVKRPKDHPIVQLRYEGLTISATRNDYTDQLVVLINTEEVTETDQDDGNPIIEVSLNDSTLYDYEKD